MGFLGRLACLLVHSGTRTKPDPRGRLVVACQACGRTLQEL